tara:strand:+ start:39 stop:1208 length:1170 start_codon:yes stop_codon:yes gene_type:complete
METNFLPEDIEDSCLLGRVFIPEQGGPSIVTIKDGEVLDVTKRGLATSRDICELEDPVGYLKKAALSGRLMGKVEDLIKNSEEDNRDLKKPWLLSPVDLQAIKAAGVTFISSLLERVIEEQAGGDPQKAREIRTEIESSFGSKFVDLIPGSDEANALKSLLISRGLWSQYLEVGIGPDPEIFTKCQPMSSVGPGSNIGILEKSVWNNPEPEIAIVVSSKGRIIGASLANDVNLRDFEGRSALLLSKAKDNNASTSLGPFIRFFNREFTIDSVRQCEIGLRVYGLDRFELTGISSMSKISRDPEELVKATLNQNHQYPDGFVLLLGTMFAPIEDRDVPGQGFTHKVDDVVKIFATNLGVLENRVKFCNHCEPWEFGVRSLITNLSERGLF